MQVLVIPNRERWPDALCERDERLRLRFAGRAGAAVLPIAGLADLRPIVRKVAVEVDAVAIAAFVVGKSIRIHRRHQPKVDSRWNGHRTQQVENCQAIVLVAMDHADYKHNGATSGAAVTSHDGASGDGRADHLLAEEETGASCGRWRNRRRDRSRRRG